MSWWRNWQSICQRNLRRTLKIARIAMKSKEVINTLLEKKHILSMIF